MKTATDDKHEGSQRTKNKRLKGIFFENKDSNNVSTSMQKGRGKDIHRKFMYASVPSYSSLSYNVLVNRKKKNSDYCKIINF